MLESRMIDGAQRSRFGFSAVREHATHIPR